MTKEYVSSALQPWEIFLVTGRLVSPAMTTMSTPIYYGYDASPFVKKLETILLLKNIPARRVDVPLYPPRPDLLKLLGLPYRRIPVLALGRDIIIDTALIAVVLERLYPAPRHPTIFPPRRGSGTTDVGLQRALGLYYADRALFGIGFGLVPWTRVPAALQADRKKFTDRNIDFEELAKQQPVTLSTLTSHLTFIEDQLSDGREWLMDTNAPGYTDISLYFVLAWIRSFRSASPIFSNTSLFPLTIAWHNKMDALVKAKQQASPPVLTKISGTDAAQAIFAAPFMDLSRTGFDPVEAQRLGITRGALISVRPEDTGKYVETRGKVVALDREEVVLETEATPGGAGAIRVHFPRLGYVIQPVSAGAKL